MKALLQIRAFFAAIGYPSTRIHKQNKDNDLYACAHANKVKHMERDN